MSFVPKVRPRPMKHARAIRQAPAFRRWIKKLQCSVKGCPNENIDPAHIRCDLPANALRGGTSLKPHDCWIIPLCRDHHNEQGRGEPSFAIRHTLHPVELSQVLWEQWLRTDTGRKWALKTGYVATGDRHPLDNAQSLNDTADS